MKHLLDDVKAELAMLELIDAVDKVVNLCNITMHAPDGAQTHYTGSFALDYGDGTQKPRLHLWAQSTDGVIDVNDLIVKGAV